MVLFDLTFGQELGEVKRRDCWLACWCQSWLFEESFGGWALGFFFGGGGWWEMKGFG